MKKNILLSTLLSAGLLTTGAVVADTAPNWNLVQASYQSMDIDEASALDFTGFSFSGSKLLNDNVFVVANYSMLSDSYKGTDIDYDTFTVGAGYRYALNTTTDAFAILSYKNAKFKASGNGESGDFSDNGYSLEAGIRSMVTDQVELTGAISYVSIVSIVGESETAATATAFYHINTQFAVGVGYTTSNDASGYNLTARYSF